MDIFSPPTSHSIPILQLHSAWNLLLNHPPSYDFVSIAYVSPKSLTTAPTLPVAQSFSQNGQAQAKGRHFVNPPIVFDGLVLLQYRRLPFERMIG